MSPSAESPEPPDAAPGQAAAVPISVDDAADELYALDRETFVGRRDELAKQARAVGDRDTAAAITALRKPSVAAWTANQLARRCPEEVAALEDLGASLRTAQDQLEGDALRQLSRQRHELVSALVERGRRIARADGVKLGEPVIRELERTVSATLADTRAARRLAAGRLVTALEPGAGLGDSEPAVDDPAPPPARPASRRRGATTSGTPPLSPEVQRRRDAAEERVARTRTAASAAATAAKDADRAAATAEQQERDASAAVTDQREQVAELAERLDRARRELAIAEDAAAAAATAARARADERDARHREAAEARTEAEQAATDLADLG